MRRHMVEIGSRYQDHLGHYGPRIERHAESGVPSVDSLDAILNDAFMPLLRQFHGVVLNKNANAVIQAQIAQLVPATIWSPPYPYFDHIEPEIFKKLSSIVKMYKEIYEFADSKREERIQAGLLDNNLEHVWGSFLNRITNVDTVVDRFLIPYVKGEIVLSDFIKIPEEVKERTSPNHFKNIEKLVTEKVIEIGKVFEDPLVKKYINSIRFHYARNPKFHQDIKDIEQLRVFNTAESINFDLPFVRFFAYAKVGDGPYTLDSHFQSGSFGVGDHGIEFVHKIQLTGLIIWELIKENMIESSQMMTDLTEGLVGNTTGRGQKSELKFADAPPPARAIQEGALSLLQLIVFTTMSEQPEIGDASRIIELLLTPKNESGNSLSVTLTRLIRAGFIGPSSFMGYFFPEPYKLDESGKLTVTSEFKNLLTTQLKAFGERHDQMRADDTNEDPENRTLVTHRGGAGRPCPVSTSCHGEPSGVQLIADVVLKVYQIVDSMNVFPTAEGN